ncbi:MAG: MoaD/ThiS family protein [Enhydrobacter sp.]|nr:MoaD/ThiS family protein [Enhydrobacter sp.]
MQVSVTLWGNLRRFAPNGAGSMVLQVADDAAVEDLAIQIGAQHDVYAAALNGKVVPLSARLSPGDRVFLFDHLHGG